MSDDSFKEFVLDQLASVPDVRLRAMFGAHGLYSGENFFGILDDGRLYFKTDETTKAAYLERGMGPFTYTARGKTMSIAYHEVPPEILESPMELNDWARQAIRLAAAKNKKVLPKRKVKPTVTKQPKPRRKS